MALPLPVFHHIYVNFLFLVFGRKSNPAHLTRCPKVVVTSYTMLHRLRKSMLEREWAVLIVDESHHVRCTKKASEPGEVFGFSFLLSVEVVFTFICDFSFRSSNIRKLLLT